MDARLITASVMVFGLVAASAAQEPAMTAEQRRIHEYSWRMQPSVAPVLDVRVTPGRPYSGDAVTEFVQVLPDGNRITRKTVTRTFRDSEGRTRREQTQPVGQDRERLHVTIVDPVAQSSFVLEPETRTAWRQAALAVATMSPAGRGGRGGAVLRKTPAPERAEAERTASVALSESSRRMAGTLKAAAERAASGEGTTKVENLGTQVVEGLAAEGTRTTTVIAAGTIGNEQPITIVSEQWFSPDLQVFVMTKHSDPRSGETTYRLSNIIRGEPDRSLFDVPPDYTVKEGGIRRTPMMRDR
jgi:hypothetical protein